MASAKAFSPHQRPAWHTTGEIPAKFEKAVYVLHCFQGKNPGDQ